MSRFNNYASHSKLCATDIALFPFSPNYLDQSAPQFRSDSSSDNRMLGVSRDTNVFRNGPGADDHRPQPARKRGGKLVTLNPLWFIDPENK